MKKSLVVLLGGVVMFGLASCDDENAAIASMVDQKSSAEVVEMIAAKYSDETFVESYTNQDFKLGVKGSASLSGAGMNISANAKANLIVDSEKGVSATASANVSVKYQGMTQKMSAEVAGEYDIESDMTYVHMKESGTESNMAISGLGYMIAGAADVPSSDDTYPEIPNFDMPTMDEILELVETYQDCIDVKVTKDDLVLTFTASDEMIASLEEEISNEISNEMLMEGSLTGTNLSVSLSFNEDLFFNGISFKASSTYSVSQMGETQSIKISAEGGISIDFGNYTYKTIKDKYTYSEITAEDLFGGYSDSDYMPYL